MTDEVKLPNEVLIPVDDVVRLKTTFANIGLAVMQILPNFQEEVNKQILLAVVRAGMKPEQFAGIDLQRGVIKKKVEEITLVGHDSNGS